MTKVYLVCGPPGSGKTTYVRENSKRGDLIVDYDAIYAAISGLPWYDRPEEIKPFVFEVREALLNRLTRPNYVDTAWVIASLPKRRAREKMLYRLNAELVMLDVPADECIRRIKNDPRRNHDADMWAKVVYDWWNVYEQEEWAKKFYNSKEWKECREYVLVRDHYLCQLCLSNSRVTAANTVHHKIPLLEAPERALDPDNLESICPECHNKEHPERGLGHKKEVSRPAKVVKIKPNPEVF